MIHYHPIKIIKRAERERLEQEVAESAKAHSSADEKASELTATVKEWISEFRRKRPARSQELKQQLGW
jgi:hypothetical protein